MNTLEKLLAAGFDGSRIIVGDDDEDDKYVHVHCWQCVALVINGVACHEHGCPNAVRREEIEEDEDTVWAHNEWVDE